MPTLTQNTSVTDRLPIGHKLTITPSVSAIVERYQGDTLLEKVSITSATSFGEYLVEINYRITCTTGTVTYTESQSVVQTLQGSRTNDNAGTGEIGEYISSSVVIGSAVSLTTDTTANVTSIVLTPGDWDVSGVIGFVPAATTSITHMSGGSSETSATMGGLGKEFATTSQAYVPGVTNEIEYAVPTTRFSVAASTTVYLTAHAIFTISTLGGYGIIGARRVR